MNSYLLIWLVDCVEVFRTFKSLFVYFEKCIISWLYLPFYFTLPCPFFNYVIFFFEMQLLQKYVGQDICNIIGLKQFFVLQKRVILHLFLFARLSYLLVWRWNKSARLNFSVAKPNIEGNLDISTVTHILLCYLDNQKIFIVVRENNTYFIVNPFIV